MKKLSVGIHTYKEIVYNSQSYQFTFIERIITKAPTHCKFEYMSKPLENIRIVDIGRYVAGPYCATLLGALGADVIRVERPDGGEDTQSSHSCIESDRSTERPNIFMM